MEDNIAEEFAEFEKEVRGKWRNLILPNPSSVYFACPYFEDIEWYFENGIGRISDYAVRKCKEYSSNLNLSISWYEIQGNYPEILDYLCKPYSDAFQAAISKNKMAFAQIEENFAHPSTSSYGIVCADVTFALAFSAFKAISNAMAEVENNHAIWDSALAMQQQMHNKLASIWSQNFESIFMACVVAENKRVMSDILNCICGTFGFSYEQYNLQKESKEIEHEIEIINCAIAKQEADRKLFREKNINELQHRIKLLEEIIEECGLAFFGEKGAKKRAAKQEKVALTLELNSILNVVPLPKEYIFTTSVVNGEEISKESRHDGWFLCATDGWVFQFDDSSDLYFLIAPSGVEICTLDMSFTEDYGRHRKIGARLENIIYDDTSCDVFFSLYELTG